MSSPFLGLTTITLILTLTDDAYRYSHKGLSLRNILVQWILSIYCIMTRKAEQERVKAIPIDNRNTLFVASFPKDESGEK